MLIGIKNENYTDVFLYSHIIVYKAIVHFSIS